MSNMSYCRFANTLGDLEECNDHIEDTDLSADEKCARKRLIEMCKDIANTYGDED